MIQHKNIKRFHLESTIVDDSHFIRQRESQEQLLVQQMKDLGYIPVLDLGPFWSTSLNEKGRYESVLSIYGVYIGVKKSWEYMGVDGAGNLYPSSTPKAKSDQSS
jgi:hypothetical protein